MDLLLSLLRLFSKIFYYNNIENIPGFSSIYLLITDSIINLIKIINKDIILIEVQGNYMYVNVRDTAIAPSLIRAGFWEKFETQLIKEMIKPGMVIVDCGANIGYYSLITAKITGKYGKVYAFEPDPDNYQLLVDNIKNNGFTNIIPIKKAVSNKSGRRKLFSDEKNFGNISFSEDNINEKILSIYAETISLDDYFKNIVNNSKVDFIKMDVEGAEGLIMEGAKNILISNDLKIFMEFSPNRITNIGVDPLKLLNNLQKYGFKIKVIDEKNEYLKQIKTLDIIRMCEKTDTSSIMVNLLLEK